MCFFQMSGNVKILNSWSNPFRRHNFRLDFTTQARSQLSCGDGYGAPVYFLSTTLGGWFLECLLVSDIICSWNSTPICLVAFQTLPVDGPHFPMAKTPQSAFLVKYVWMLATPRNRLDEIRSANRLHRWIAFILRWTNHFLDFCWGKEDYTIYHPIPNASIKIPNIWFKGSENPIEPHLKSISLWPHCDCMVKPLPKPSSSI